MNPKIEIRNGILYLDPHDYVHHDYEREMIPVKLITFVGGIRTVRIENSQILNRKCFIIKASNNIEITFISNQYQQYDEYNKNNQEDIKKLIDARKQIQKAVENSIGGLNINYPKSPTL
jgi:hypothetical protein